MTQTEIPHSEATVLIVDDEQGLTDLYAAWLEESYTVVTAYGGSQALEVIDETVDVVLLDRRMPSLSGDKVLEELRDRGFECPVAMVTAVDPDLDIINLDIDDYVIKSLSEETLHQLVETLLHRTTYDRQTRDYAALAAKKAALDSSLGESTLAASDEYANLQEQLAEAQSDVNASMEELLRTPMADSLSGVL